MLEHYRPPVIKSDGLTLRHRSKRAGVVLVATLSVGLLSTYVVRQYIEHVLHDLCIEKPGTVPSDKCPCMASEMAGKLVTFDYAYRRLYKDQDFTDAEIEGMWQACGLK